MNAYKLSGPYYTVCHPFGLPTLQHNVYYLENETNIICIKQWSNDNVTITKIGKVRCSRYTSLKSALLAAKRNLKANSH